MKELLKYLPSPVVTVITVSIAAIGMGVKLSEIRQSILSDIKRTHTLLETVADNQKQLFDIENSQNIIILQISDLSKIIEKSNVEMIKMIKEASKSSINMPLLERIEEDIIRLNEDLPHKTDTLIRKIGVRKQY